MATRAKNGPLELEAGEQAAVLVTVGPSIDGKADVSWDIALPPGGDPARKLPASAALRLVDLAMVGQDVPRGIRNNVTTLLEGVMRKRGQ